MEFKTFFISTSAKPEDIVIIKTKNNVVVLDDAAGTGIISDSGEPVDGGTF